jgi:very-short-patch-repair endonuclease
VLTDASALIAAAPQRARRARPAPALCVTSGATNCAPGEPFRSVCAPARASAAEGDLHHRLAQRLEFGAGFTAVRVARPFFDHLEVWPDIVLPELRVAIEYDTTGRDGLEHVGRREAVDRRKDRALRATGWEVVRVRCSRLQPIGEHDVVASGVTAKLIDRVLDELRVIRGDLIVDCYLR